VARAHGKDAVFSIDDSGGSLRNISAHVNNVSGLPGARQLSEVTAFGDGGVKNIPGLVNVSFTVSGVFDNTATTGSYTVLNGLRSTTATSTFEYGPAGSTASSPKLTGECWMSEFTVDASVSDAVPFSATFQVDGTVTATAY
jgi:hypothetical protein